MLPLLRRSVAGSSMNDKKGRKPDARGITQSPEILSRNPRLIRERSWFRVDSGRIHGASHRVSRWKGVPLSEYIPIKKSELRYTRSCPPRPLSSAVPLALFALLFPLARPPTPLTSGFCFSSREKRLTERGERSLSRFFLSNYFTVSTLKNQNRPSVVFFFFFMQFPIINTSVDGFKSNERIYSSSSASHTD